MNKAITLLTALTFPLASLAAVVATVAPTAALADKPDWRYVEGGYTKLDFDNNESFEPDGLTINGKY